MPTEPAQEKYLSLYETVVLQSQGKCMRLPLASTPFLGAHGTLASDTRTKILQKTSVISCGLMDCTAVQCVL